MAANGVERQLLVFDRRKSRDGYGRLHAHLRRRLGHSGVADMANLAMLFVGRMPMPVAGCLHGKHAHAKHEGHGQQSYG
jgi:hypothetical protein